MLNQISIVPLIESYLDDIISIEEDYSTDPWTRETFIREISNYFSYNFALKLGSNVIGYANFWFVTDFIELNNIAIDKNLRGRGIGKYFLQFIINVSNHLNAKKIFLEVKEGNYRALNLYKSFNFEVINIRKKYYKDGSNAILMEKIL